MSKCKPYFFLPCIAIGLLGCAPSTESVIVKKEIEENPERCLYILAEGPPHGNANYEKYVGYSPGVFEKMRSGWDYCQANASEEIKTQARSLTIWKRADIEVSRNNYSEAWRILSLTPDGDIKITQQYLKNNPKVQYAMKDSFSIDSLRTKKAQDFSPKYPYKQIDIASHYLTESEIKKYQKNITDVFGPMPESMSSYIVRFGRISGVQFVNRSTINTNAGANFGAIAGQAMYLDNTSFKNYSAMNQLGAGLVGAIVGSGLDNPSITQYQRTYWITLNNGETISIVNFVSDQTHIPQGICVEVKGSSLLATNESNCRSVTKQK